MSTWPLKKLQGRVARIHEMYAQGSTYRAIAKEMGVSYQRIQQIVRPPIQVVNMLKKRAGDKCESCGLPLRNGHVHHAEKVPVLPKAIDSIDKLLYLCPTCHRIAHRQEPRDWTPEFNAIPFVKAARSHNLKLEWCLNHYAISRHRLMVNGHLCLLRVSNPRPSGPYGLVLHRPKKKADFCSWLLPDGRWLIMPFFSWPRAQTMFVPEPKENMGSNICRHDYQNFIEAWHLFGNGQ